MNNNKEEIVVVNGKEYKKSNPYLTIDWYTGEYILKGSSNTHNVITGLTARNIPTGPFNRNDGNTFLNTRIDTAYSVVYDQVRMNPSKFGVVSILVRCFEHGPIVLYVKDLDNFLEEKDLVRGTNNTDAYFFKHELQFMDTPKPYRKFNNTYSKKTVQDILGRPVTKKDLVTEEYKLLSKEIMKRNQDMGVDSTTHLELEGIKPTIGWEIETVTGSLSEEDAHGINFKTVHDGSLRGPNGESPLGAEYVSGVMYGDAGFIQLHKMCKILSKRCTIDHRSGVHIHLGSLNWGKEDIVYSYILAELIENELFSMLPRSRRTNSYCRKLTPLTVSRIPRLRDSSSSKVEYDIVIDELFNDIFAEALGQKGTEVSRYINRNGNHPKGSKCGYDKSSQRYCWLNYVTLLFDTKGAPNSRTLEIRNHGATLNYKKIKNWTKIFVAFINFVNNHKEAIRNKQYVDKSGTKFPISVELMVKLSYPKRGNELVDYIRERKEVFKTADESVDYVAVESTEKSIKEIIIPVCV